MKQAANPHLGFTLIELMLALAVVAILAGIAIPAYQNYARRAYYAEVVVATEPYKLAVVECVQNLKTITGCTAGTNTIQTGIAAPTGAVNSLTVNDGVITVTPVASHGIVAGDTYILTPTMQTNNTVTWASSGGGVDAGYAK